MTTLGWVIVLVATNAATMLALIGVLVHHRSATVVPTMLPRQIRVIGEIDGVSWVSMPQMLKWVEINGGATNAEPLSFTVPIGCRVTGYEYDGTIQYYDQPYPPYAEAGEFFVHAHYTIENGGRRRKWLRG